MGYQTGMVGYQTGGGIPDAGDVYQMQVSSGHGMMGYQTGDDGV